MIGARRTPQEVIRSILSRLEIARDFAEDSSRRRMEESEMTPDHFAGSLLKDASVHHCAQAVAFWQAIALVRQEASGLLEVAP